jgi:hypothetical protein
MKLEDGRLTAWMGQIRADGSIMISNAQLPVPVDEWRSAIRRAARRDGLRIRTGVANCGCCVWACHVDHVTTDAQMRAAARAVGAVLWPDGEDGGKTYRELHSEERRRQLRSVPSGRDGE